MKKQILLFSAIFSGYTFLLLLLYFPLVFQSQVLTAPDSLIPQASSMALDKLQAESGSYPLWQPWIFSGMPTVEAFSYLSGLYYPNLLFNLFHTDGVLLQLLHLAFAGAGTFLLLRDLRLSLLASIAGGLIFLCNPFFSAMLVHGHGSQLMTTAYMPWMLWAAMRFMDRGGVAEAGIFALIAGLQLQRAHVQMAYYSWLMMLLLVVVLFATRRWVVPQAVQRGGLFVIASVTAIAMAAAIYLPASHYAEASVRGAAVGGGGAAWEYATLWSLHPLEAITFLFPGFFGFGGVTYWGFMPFTDFPHYAGLVVLLLALMGLIMRRREPMTWLFAGVGFLALLLAFGRFFSPIFDLFYSFAPLFSRFRVPSMALIMLYFALAALAAIGLHELLERKPQRLLKVLRLSSIVVALLLLIFLALEEVAEHAARSLFPLPQVDSFELVSAINSIRWEQLSSSVIVTLTLLLLVAGVLWLLLSGKISSKYSASLLVLLAVGDLLWVTVQVIYPSAHSLRTPLFADKQQVAPAFQHDDVTRFLASQPKPFRIYPAGNFFTENKFALFGIESVGGYHPAKLKSYDDLLQVSDNLASIALLRMLNVHYIVSPAPIEHPTLTLATSGTLQRANGSAQAFVYRLQEPAPRAWFVSRVVPFSNKQELYSHLLDDTASLSVAYVEAQQWQGAQRFSEGTIQSVTTQPESIKLNVNAPNSSFLVLSEIYYPNGWQVMLDGKATSMLRVNGVLRGVNVPAGNHAIHFSYNRHLFEQSQWIALAGFIIALLMIAGGLLWKHLLLSGEKRVVRGFHTIR
uniref:YfhO family protein n=1 Tax=Chlorobium chlorochromatii (strain CaD3) TaxID=340177 RepID=Q3APG7_CHLCH